MKKDKKAEIGWSFVVKLIIGLLVLAVLIFIAASAKGGFGKMFSQLADIFV